MTSHVPACSRARRIPTHPRTVWQRWFMFTTMPRANSQNGWCNFHGHHDLSLATLHVHLDDDSCMEVTALKGSSGDVKHLADHVIAERGVRYGRLVMIPLQSRNLKKSFRRDKGQMNGASLW